LPPPRFVVRVDVPCRSLPDFELLRRSLPEHLKHLERILHGEPVKMIVEVTIDTFDLLRHVLHLRAPWGELLLAVPVVVPGGVATGQEPAADLPRPPFRRLTPCRG